MQDDGNALQNSLHFRLLIHNRKYKVPKITDTSWKTENIMMFLLEQEENQILDC